MSAGYGNMGWFLPPKPSPKRDPYWSLPSSSNFSANGLVVPKTLSKISKELPPYLYPPMIAITPFTLSWFSYIHLVLGHLPWGHILHTYQTMPFSPLFSLLASHFTSTPHSFYLLCVIQSDQRLLTQCLSLTSFLSSSLDITILIIYYIFYTKGVVCGVLCIN